MAYTYIDMSEKRSSPDIPSIAHSNSDSALNSLSNTKLDNQQLNITKRHKRNFQDFLACSQSMECHKDGEIQEMLMDIKSQQDQKFEALTAAMSVIIDQNEGIKKSVQTMSTQYEELLVKSASLERENSELKQRVSSLENQMELSQKRSLNSTIEIRNIPKVDNESKELMVNLVKKVGTLLGLESSINTSDIRNIFRTKSNTIVVDFVSACRKEAVISRSRIINKIRREKKESQLSTSDMQLNGPATTIYISEALTKKTRRLFYLAREHIKNKKLRAAWTDFGNLYVKVEDASSPTRIAEEDDLHRVVQ